MSNDLIWIIVLLVIALFGILLIITLSGHGVVQPTPTPRVIHMPPSG